MKAYSTAQVARMVGVHKRTLLRWVYDGKIANPKLRNSIFEHARVWTDRDVERVHIYKAANYRKGRGRKKKT